MFLAFIFGISWAWAKGLSIECGCFGGGGRKIGASSEYKWDIARDTGLLLLLGSGWCVRPRTLGPWITCFREQ